MGMPCRHRVGGEDASATAAAVARAAHTVAYGEAGIGEKAAAVAVATSGPGNRSREFAVAETSRPCSWQGRFGASVTMAETDAWYAQETA